MRALDEGLSPENLWGENAMPMRTQNEIEARRLEAMWPMWSASHGSEIACCCAWHSADVFGIAG